MNAPFLDTVHANPWAQELVDLPSLNADASDAIESAIHDIRETARHRPRALRASAVTVLGPAGAGKTHLFARLRRRLGPRAVFVHIRPLVGTEMTARFVLHEIVRQLGFVSGELRQIDALVGSLLSYVTGSPSGFPRFFLEETTRLERDARFDRLEHAVDLLLMNWQDIDESYLRRLLSVPFEKSPIDRAYLAWLSGRELDAVQLERAGAKEALGDEVVMPALRSLAVGASVGAPIVVVFDQLENLIERERESARLLAYAQLTTELVDTAPGLVLVQMALDTEWAAGIEPSFNLAQRSRLTMNRQLLGLPTPREREELLRLWVDRLPDKAAPFPWPFGEARLGRLCGETGMTPRMLLLALRQAVLEAPSLVDKDERAPVNGIDAAKPDGIAPALSTDASPGAPALDEALAKTFDEYLVDARQLLDEAAEQKRCIDAWRLTDGLLCAIRFASGLEIVDSRASRTAQIRVRRGPSDVHVALLQQPHHRTIGTALNKLADLVREQEVIVIRERAHEFPPTWTDTLARRGALLKNARAVWHALERDDAVRLLALDEMLKAARSRDITDDAGCSLEEEVVARWVVRSLAVESWPVVAALMGDQPREEFSPSSPAKPTPPPSGAATTLVLPVLSRLRLASLERLIRETARVDRTITRATVLAELEALSSRVRWVGRTIVYFSGEEP